MLMNSQRASIGHQMKDVFSPMWYVERLSQFEDIYPIIAQKDEFSIMQLFLDEDIVNLIVECTNTFAQQEERALFSY